MKLEGVSAPFELVLDGADKIAKQLDELTKRAEKLERLKVGGKGVDINLSGVDKAISQVDARLEKLTARFSKLSMSKKLGGTDFGVQLGNMFEGSAESAGKFVDNVRAGLLEVVDATNMLSEAAKKRLFPAGEAKKFNAELKTLTAQIKQVGAGASEHLTKRLSALGELKKMANELQKAGKLMPVGEGSPELEAMFTGLKQKSEMASSAFEQNFFSAIERIKEKLLNLGEQPISFQHVGKAIVSDINKAFATVGTEFRGVINNMNAVTAQLTLSEQLAADILSPEVTDSIAKLQERMNRLGLRQNNIAELNERINDPEADGTDKSAAEKALRQELALVEQDMRSVASANKQLSDSFFAQQRALIESMQAGATGLEGDFKGNAAAIQSIADQTMRFKQGIGDSLANLELGSNVLREQESLVSKLVGIVRAGGEAEAASVKEKLESINAYKKSVEYADALAQAEKTISTSRGEGNATLKMSIALLQEQANALKQATIVGSGDEAVAAFERLVAVEKKLGSQSSVLALRESLAGIGKEVATGAVPSLGKLNNAIAKFEGASGKAFSDQREEMAMLDSVLNGLVQNYGKLKKSATAAAVAEQKQAVDAIEKLNKMMLASPGAGQTQAADRQKFVEAAKQELALTERKVQFEAELERNFNKVYALQVAGVSVAKNYQQMQELYLKAKKEESSLEEVIAAKLRDKGAVVKKLAHEVAGMQAAAGRYELVPEMQVAQLKGALETLELMRTIMKQMESKGVKMPVIGGSEYNIASVDKQIAGVTEELAARKRVSDEANKERAIDEAINAIIEKRAALEKEVVTILQSAHAAVERQAAGYNEYMRAVDAAVTAVQKQTGITKDQLNLDQLRTEAVRELFTEYSRLASSKLDMAGPTEATKSLQKQRDILLKLADIIDNDYKFRIDGKEAEVGLATIKSSLTAVEEKLKLAETVWRDASKSFMKFDSAPLRKMEQRVSIVSDGMDELSSQVKVTGENGKMSFESMLVGITKAENPLNAYRNALKNLHTEQLSNAAATDTQRIATLSELAAVQRQSAAVSALKQALQGVDDKMRSAGLSLTAALDNPQAAIENMAADPKKLAAMEQAFQKLSLVTTEMTAAQSSKSSIFSALASEVQQFSAVLDGVHEKISSIVSSSTKIDLSTVNVTPEAGAAARAGEEQKLLQTIKEQYTALLQGVDVLKNWEAIRTNVNEASRRGLEIGKENIAVLTSQDKVFGAMLEHAKQLLASSRQDTSKPIEARSAAMLEAEKIVKRTQQAMKDLGMDTANVPFDDMLKEVKQLKGELGYIPESLRKAYQEADIFEAALKDSVAALKAAESNSGIFDKLSSDAYRITAALSDWERAQKKIYRDSEFITASGEEQITQQRNKVQEAERFAASLRKILKLTEDIKTKSATVGVDASTLNTAGGAAQLSAATKTNETAKTYTDIVKANKELQGMIIALQRAFASSEHLKNSFAGYDDVLKQAKTEVDKVDTALSAHVEKKQRMASRSAGSNIFDIFRMSWFIQLRAFWGMYMGVTEVMQAVMEYTHTMNVMKAVTQASVKTMDDLGERFDNLSRVVPIALTKTTEAALTVAKAGMTAEETIKIIESASRLAYATKSDITTVADIITISIRSWGLAADQSDQIANVMFNAISKSRASIEGLQQAMGYLSGIAPQANVSLQETLGLVGVLTNAGLSMSKAATYSRQVLNDLMNPSAKLTSIIGTLGLKLSEVDPRFNSLAQIFKKLHDAGMDVSQAFEGMSVRGANAFSIALSNASALDDFTESLGSSGDLLREYGDTTEDLASKFQFLMNAIVELANTAKEFFGPFISAFVDGLIDSVNKITDLLKTLDSMSFGGLGAVLQFVAKAAGEVALPLLGFFGIMKAVKFAKYIGGIADIGVAIGGVHTAATVAAGGVRMFGGALAGLASAHPVLLAITAALTILIPLFSDFSSAGTEAMMSVAESVDQLRETMQKLNTGTLSLGKSTELGQRTEAFRDQYGPNSSTGAYDSTGGMMNTRAAARSLLTALIQSGDADLADVGRKLMRDMFDPEKGGEAAKKWVDNMISEIDAALEKHHFGLAERVLGDTEVAVAQVKVGASGISKALDEALSKATAGKNWAESTASDDIMEQAVGRTIGTLRDIFQDIKIDDVGDSVARTINDINNQLSQMPLTSETVGTLDAYVSKLTAVQSELSGTAAAFEKMGTPLENLDAKFQLAVKAADELMTRMREMRGKALEAGTADTRVGKSFEDKKALTEAALKQQDTGVLQDIQTHITDAEAAAGGLKYAVQLAFVAPTPGNIAAVKQRMLTSAEDIRKIMERVGQENKSLFSIGQESAKAMVDSLNSSWAAQLEMLKTFDADGRLTFNDLMGGAKKLASQLSFEKAGISFENLVRNWGVGAEVLKDIKNLAKDVPLDSYDNLVAKVNEVADVWSKMRKMKRAFDPKDIDSVGDTLTSLVKKQFEYIKSMIKTRATMRNLISDNTTFKETLAIIGNELTTIFNPGASGNSGTVMLADRVTNAFSDLREELRQNKDMLQNMYDDMAVNNAELEKLGAITGQNVEAAMDTEKAYSSMAATIASNMSTVREQILSNIDAIADLERAFKDAQAAIAEDQFAFQTARNDTIQSTRDPNTNFAYDQEKLIRQREWVRAQGSGANPTLQGENLEDALKSLRDGLMEFAAANPYQGAGKDAMREADSVNGVLLKLQQKRMAMLEVEAKMREAQLKLQMATYAKLETIATTIGDVLSALTGRVDAITGKKADGTPAKSAAAGGKTSTSAAVAAAGADGDKTIKELSELIAKHEELSKAYNNSAEYVDALNRAMGIQAQKTLSSREAMDEWVKTLGTGPEIVQRAWNDMFNNTKDAIKSAFTSGLRAAIEGGEADIDSIFYELYWTILDSYTDMMLDLAANEMFGEGGVFKSLWNGEDGATKDGVETMAKTGSTLAEATGAGTESAMVTAATTMGTSATQFSTAVTQFSAAIQSMVAANQAKAATDQALVASDAMSASRNAQTAAQNSAAAAQQGTAAASQTQAGGMQLQAANTQAAKSGAPASPTPEGGGTTWYGRLFSGIAGFFGMGFDEGGLVDGGNSQKDSTTIAAKKGEYVIDNSAVAKYGVEFFNSLNEGKAQKAFSQIPEVANDDVSNASSASSIKPPETETKRERTGQDANGNGNNSIKINNLVDPKVMEKYTATDRGKRAIMNIVSQHPYFSRK